MMNERKRKFLRWLMPLAFILWLAVCVPAAAVETDQEDMLDYRQIQEAMDEMLPESVQLSFAELVGQLVDGDIQGVFDSLKDYLLDQIFYELRGNRAILVQMVGIVFISAVFTNFSMAFSAVS